MTLHPGHIFAGLPAGAEQFLDGRAADKRELPPAVLLERIAATVLGEPDLINAVLDDE